MSKCITVMADDLIGSPSNNHEILAGGFEPKHSHRNENDSPSFKILLPFSIKTANGLTVTKYTNKQTVFSSFRFLLY